MRPVKPRIELTGWKAREGKPPIPKGFELSTKHGAQTIGKRTYYGYQILQRTNCDTCGKRVRPVAAYIGAIALRQLLQEDYATQKAIIELNLRRFLEKQRCTPRCGDCSAKAVGDDPLLERTANERRTA